MDLGQPEQDMSKPRFAKSGRFPISRKAENSIVSKRDMLSSQEANANFRACFDSSPVGMFVLDDRFRIIQANEAVLTWLGKDMGDIRLKRFGEAFACKHQVEGLVNCGLTSHCPACRMLQGFVSLFRTGEPIRDIELMKSFYIEGAPMDVWLKVSMVNLLVDGRKQALINLVNVTELKRNMLLLEEGKARYEKLYAFAEKSNQAKNQFLANVNHEIRTPLNGLMGMIQLVLQEKLEPESLESLKSAYGCAESLLRIINDMLDYAKMEAGKLEIEKSNYSLPELLQSVIKPHQVQAAQKGLDIILDISPDVDTHLVGDPKRVGQILNNLLGNAVKFTEEGEIRLEVRKNTTEDGIMLACTVTDTGIGISEADIGKLFHRFSQVDGSISRKYGGTGLGLAIVRQLAEQMGGKSWATSVKGTGSSFGFSVQYVEGIPASPPSVSQPIEKPGETVLHLLVVEDDPISRSVLCRMAQGWGHHVDIAVNGMEACEKVEEIAYDIVFMDIQMPLMDGETAMRRIREREQASSHTYIVVVTTNSFEGEQARFLAAGADGFLPKPVNRQALHTLLLQRIAFLSGRMASQPLKADRFLGQDEMEEIRRCVLEMSFFTGHSQYDLVEKLAARMKKKLEHYRDDGIRDLMLKMMFAARRRKKEDLVDVLEKLQTTCQIPAANMQVS